MTAAAVPSLRQQLEAALANALWDDCDLVLAIQPIIEAWGDARVAAAQAATAEQIAAAIEATEYPHPFSTPRDELVYKLATQEAANRARALARSAPGTTEGGDYYKLRENDG